MEENYISALEAAKEFRLYLRVVVSVKTFDNFNSFYNIYDLHDEPCRRIVVLTPYQALEEVYDEKPDEPIKTNTLIDGNLWLKEYPLTTNPKNIPLEDILVSKELVKELFEEKNRL